MLTAAVCGGYLALIDERTSSRVVFVALVLGAVAIVELCAWTVRRPLTRSTLLATASFLLVVWTILGAMSIGVLLAPGTVFALVAVARASQDIPAAAAGLSVAAGGAAAVAITALGLSSTS